MADSNLRTKRTTLQRMRKRLVVPLLLRAVDAFLTVGDCNEQYYLAYGARRRQLFRSPFPVDSDSLDLALVNREDLRTAVREGLGLSPESLALLCVGKLTASKCPQDAIKALPAVRAGLPGRDVHLIFCGDGPEMESLQKLSRALCPGKVHFPGFVNTSQLPGYYVAADLLVHPSSVDAHPLATSEAVYCGLPVVVSDQVGSVGEPTMFALVRMPLSTRSATSKPYRSELFESWGAPKVALQWRSARARIGKERTLRVSVEGFVRAIEYASDRRPRRRGR